MDVSSVSNSPYSPQAISAAAAAKRADAANSGDTQTQREPSPDEVATRKAQEPRRPVVNTQGQTTGQILNTTA
jgi:hypothetical protein